MFTRTPLNLQTYPQAIDTQHGQSWEEEVVFLRQQVNQLRSEHYEVMRALKEHLEGLNKAGVLDITQAQINATPIGIKEAAVGNFTTIGATTPGAGTFTQVTTTVTTGTPPFVVASTTKVANLNADLLDDKDWVAPGTIGSTTPNTGAFTTLSASGVITSTVATGTAPLTIASTTKVANLNVDQLDGADWAAPAAIGSGTPADGTFTKVTIDDANHNLDIVSSSPRYTFDSGDYLEYTRAGNLLSYYIGNALIWSATSTTFAFAGGITINNSGALQGITQVAFPATQVPSADPNTLDDYEEGTSAPTVTAFTGTFTSVSAALKYTKVGNRVFFNCAITITTNGTAASWVTFTLPFQPAEAAAVSGVNQTTGMALCGYVGTGGGGDCNVFKYDATYPGASATTLLVQGQYRV